MFRLIILVLTVSAAGATQQSFSDDVPDPVAGTKTITELLEAGYEIIDYELGTISINRFQVVERVMLVKRASVYTCSFRVERNEVSQEPEKVSTCVPVR